MSIISEPSSPKAYKLINTQVVDDNIKEVSRKGSAKQLFITKLKAFIK